MKSTHCSSPAARGHLRVDQLRPLDQRSSPSRMCSRSIWIGRPESRTARNAIARAGSRHPDRKSVVEGKRVSVRVDLGGRRIIKKKRQKRSGKVRKGVIRKSAREKRHRYKD